MSSQDENAKQAHPIKPAGSSCSAIVDAVAASAWTTSFAVPPDSAS